MPDEVATQAPTPEVTTQQPATPTNPTTPGVKMVPESDLLALKGSLEGKLTESESKYTTFESSSKQLLSDTQSKLYSAEARVKTLEGEATTTKVTMEGLTTVKVELDASREENKKHNETILTLRRESLSKTYNFPLANLQEKDMAALTALEEALKAVQTTGGAYALAAGGGGTSPQTPQERALAAIHAAETRPPRGSQ